MPLDLSLVLPVHNQADHISCVVRSFAAALSQLAIPYEIILIPNGSADGSEGVCRDLARELPCVRCLAIEDRGWGRAVRAGIGKAQGSLICFTNSARTRAVDLQRIVAVAAKAEGAVVKAVRQNRQSIARHVGSLAYSLLCRSLLGIRSADVNGTPKVFPRKAAALLNLVSDDDLLDLEFMWRCQRGDLPLIEIPLQSSPRHGGRSTTGLKSALRLYLGAFRFWRRTRVGSLHP